VASRIAVLIPLYNHADYVGEALEAVLGQTRPADRIVVIDDGSPDDSLAVAKQFESRGVEVSGRENRGAHATWHELVEKTADCDFCALLNSDDAWHPHHLETCVGALEADPTKRVAAAGLEMFDENSGPLVADHPRAKWLRAVSSLQQREDLDLAGRLGIANFIVTTTNVVARHEALVASPFQPYRFNHDYFFLAQSAIRGELFVVPDQITVKYRVHSSNTIGVGPEPIIREMLRMHVDLHREFGRKGFRDAAERRRFASFVRASWDSVSSHHAGLLQECAARALARLSDEECDALLADLPAAELETFPNRSLVNALEEGGVLGAEGGSALAARFEEARAQRAAFQKKTEAADQLARLRQQILSSKALAFGRLLGLGKGLVRNEGKTPAEKLAKLKAEIEASSWARRFLS